MEIEEGQVYKHFKGNYYYIMNIGYDSASNDGDLKKMVIYRALYGDKKIWVRSYDEFISQKEFKDGTKINRFELVEYEKVNIKDRNI